MIETLQDVRDTVISMLCAELSCTSEELTDGQVHITVRNPDAHQNPAHRLFDPHPGKIGIASLGIGGIVCVDEEHLDWAEEVFRPKPTSTRDELFMPDRMGKMADLVRPEGLLLYGPFPRFAVSHSTVTHVEAPMSYSVRVVDQDGADAIGQRARWHNAIYKVPTETARPTMIAAIAEQEGEIVGVCGASSDSPFMWQLGIDVAPEHQGRGLAPALTSAVAEAVLDEGKLPYYGTSASNIPSMRTALAAGFKPTWVEVLSRPADS
ncbi:MAG: GNAT family N-acetyltransferase [Chloroflexi bacterium]|jgi:RimJ/RimL family protein N-acetyltransferase|nr:GNAT family N-acetyltransferase [Chloroflexota bacterium]MBT5627741.1 GNAT family N-acetyltransferase [Chloroflexota bacterium]